MRTESRPATTPHDQRAGRADRAAHGAAAPGARVHRPGGAPARLPAERARDRRGRRAVVTVHRARAPRRAPGQGLPPPRPDQAARASRSRSSRSRARRSSAGRCATSRCSATSPPAPACSRPSTSRRCCPLPEDFTGDGELFMLRVRGESMIDAGIFDGDFVVVRAQPTADNGDIVVAGIPGEEATVKTFLRRRGKVVLRPANPTMDELVFDARRRADLRQGRHAAAPALTPRNAPEHLGAAHEIVAVHALPARCARARDHPGRSCTPAMPCAAKRATSVQPSFGRTPSRPAPIELGDERMRRGSAARAATRSAPRACRRRRAARRARRSRRRSSATARRAGSRRASQASGTTLLATPPSMRTTWSASRYSSPSTSTTSACEPRAAGEHRRGAVDRVRRPSTAGRCGRACPSYVARTWIVPWQPASIHPPVGSSSTATSPATSSGCSANRSRRPLCSSATSSPS